MRTFHGHSELRGFAEADALRLELLGDRGLGGIRDRLEEPQPAGFPAPVSSSPARGPGGRDERGEAEAVEEVALECGGVHGLPVFEFLVVVRLAGGATSRRWRDFAFVAFERVEELLRLGLGHLAGLAALFVRGGGLRASSAFAVGGLGVAL